ncbi:MAG: tetratricopeptide repeat protein [Leptolyngbyaceae cyanobacterium]
MKFLRLCIAAAVLTSLLASNRVLAQSAAELQAGALLESAERLDRNGNDIDATTAAYEQALQAYDEIGDTDKSLEILDTLHGVNWSACRDDEAMRWAIQAVARFDLPQRDFNLNDKLSAYQRWVSVLGDWHVRKEQPEQALELYDRALKNLETMPPAINETFSTETEAKFLRSRLSLLPSESHEATVTLERLTDVRQRLGAISEIDGLLSDATFLRNTIDNKNSASVIELSQRVLELSRLNNYPSGEAQALTLLSQQAFTDASYDQALSYGGLVTTRFNQLQGIEPWLADARYTLARTQQELGNDSEAIGQYLALLNGIENAPDSYYRISKYGVVSNLIELYERTGSIAQANQMSTEYSDTLNGASRALPLLNRRPLPFTVRTPRLRSICLSNSPTSSPRRIAPRRFPSRPLPPLRSSPIPVQ